MDLLKSKTILIALLLASVIGNAGGGWTKNKNEGYFKLSEWWTIGDQHFTDQGLLDPNTTTGLFNTNFYGEFGISNRFTAIAFMPLFSRNLMNNTVSGVNGKTLVEGDAINGVGDLDLSIKYGILKNTKWVLASTLQLGIPIGKTAGGKDGNLQTGDGEFNQMLKLDLSKGYGVSWLKASSYVNIYSGFNNRTNSFSDEIRYGIESGLGWKNNKYWLIGRVDGIASLKNGATADMVTSTSVFANNAEYLAYSVEAAAYLNKAWGISASFSSLFFGKIIMASPAFSVGVFFDLKKKEKKDNPKK